MNPFVFFAAIALLVVVIAYVARFWWILGLPLADKPDVWGQFGDYLGGSLNPILSFITILLLIKSLELQKLANSDLKDEVKENRKTEKLRSFGVLFFNMIDSQKKLLESFAISQEIGAGASSIIYLESEIERMREAGASGTDISCFIEDTDSDDRIYGILRAFYVTVRIVSEKLVDADGFSHLDRKEYLLTLINFTDFAQLRLIILAVQFMDYPYSNYLRGNSDLNSVLREVGLHFDPY